MALSKEKIEYLHDTGKMPDWIYYQQNGKSASENYREQKLKIKQRFKDAVKEDQIRREAEARATERFQEDLENEVQTALEKIVGKL